MFTSAMVAAILTVLQWVFWIVAALYVAGSLAIVLRHGDGMTASLAMAGVALLAGWICRTFRHRLAPKTGKPS